MKKLTFVLAVLSFFVVAAYAGQSRRSAQSMDQRTAKSSTANPRLRTTAGKISDDGKTFTADKGGKQWTLKNPEDVKGHEGHHVNLQAQVYKDTNELHVLEGEATRYFHSEAFFNAFGQRQYNNGIQYSLDRACGCR